MRVQREQLLYENPLRSVEDVSGFILEGEADITFSNQRMCIYNTLEESKGQKANTVYWCNQSFPDRIEINWDFYPLANRGLCVFFFSALGMNGESIFSSSLLKRTGEYQMYHSSDINAFHVSYYRRMYESERAFHVVNLRKSRGFYLVAQGADPIPYPMDGKPPYHMKVIKYKDIVGFYINDLQLFDYQDDGTAFGPLLTGGYIGFRQMSPMVAEYSNLKVYQIRKAKN